MPTTLTGVAATGSADRLNFRDNATLFIQIDGIATTGSAGLPYAMAIQPAIDANFARAYVVLPTLVPVVGPAGIAVTNPILLPAGVPLPEPIVQAAMQFTTSRVIVGHPVTIFDIPQVVNLTYPVSTYEGIMMNNFPVNRTDFRLVRGVQNEILFMVRDIDRKPVTLAMGDVLTINITNVQRDQLLLRRSLTVNDLQSGLYTLVTLPAEMDTWPTGPVPWSMTYTRASDGSTVMLWSDQNYSPFSSAYVTHSPYSGPAGTVTLVWSDFTVMDDSNYYSAALAAAAQDGFVNGMQTYVIDMTNFTGTVRVDGSLVAHPANTPESMDWFAATSDTYTANTGQAVLNVQGNFVWTRIVVTVGSGTLNQLQYKD